MNEMNAEERAHYCFDLFSMVEFPDKIRTKTIRKSCALALVHELMKDVNPKSRDFIYWANVKLYLLEL